jgi:hypothetical protein
MLILKSHVFDFNIFGKTTMSADVSLWDPETCGLPQNYAEATAIYLKLSDGEAITSTNKLTKFVDCIELQLQDSELDQDLRSCLESIQRYGKTNRNALFTVGLPHYGAVEALKLIIASAQAAGMIVFYDLMGAVFLPNGQIYPVGKAEMWHGALNHADDSEFPRTLKGFQKLADPLFAAMAERHGMKENKIPYNHGEGYVREVALGQQYIKWNFEGSGGEYKISLDAYVESTQVSEIYAMFSFWQSRLILKTIPNSLNAENIAKYKSVTNKFKEINSLISLEDTIEFLECYVFSEYLDRSQSLKGFDAVFNASEKDTTFNWRAGQKGFYSPHSLILARLAGNPRFEDIVKIYEADIDWGANSAAKVTELSKLLDYLRNEVKPIV